MKVKLLGSFLIIISSMLILMACDNSVKPGLEDSLELYTGLEVIPEASNTTVTVNKGSDLTRDGFFNITVKNAEPNERMHNGTRVAWCLEWKKPLRSNNDDHPGVKWYDTRTNDKWKPLNYFLSIRRDLQKEDRELTYREFQAVIWSIAGYMKIAPEFDVNKLSDSELPSRLRTNGAANFSKEKVNDIVNRVLANYSTATITTFGNVGQTADPEQDIVTEDPIPDEIDEETKIFIYFDSSGSMNSTLPGLTEMRNTLLKDALLPLYNNNETAYDENVTITSVGRERTFNWFNLQGQSAPDGNVIVLIFQDEAASGYHASGSNWDENSTRTFAFETDMTALRTRLESFAADPDKGSGYYRGVIFQVDQLSFGGPNFKKLIGYVQNGEGNYAPPWGLSDRFEFRYVYDVQDGDTAQNYLDLVTGALEDLGFDLTPPPL